MEHKKDAGYYWEKYHLADEMYHKGLDMLSESSSPVLVAEILAVHKLMEVLQHCAEKAEIQHSGAPRNPYPKV